MSSKVLITGGAGFVGSHLADALLEQGCEVRVFDNLSPQVHPAGSSSYLSRDVELVFGDMRDLDAVQAALRGVEVVFHLAAAVGVGQSMYAIAEYVGTNSLGTANLLQAILNARPRGNGIKKLLVASSMSIYGEGSYQCPQCGVRANSARSTEQLLRKRWDLYCPDCQATLTPVPTDERKPLQCSSYYALSKKDQEEMVLLFGRTYQVPAVALRFFNIYGTRQSLANPYTGVAAIFASRLLNAKAPLVFEDGRQMRDFVSVHDVVSACLLAMRETGADGMALNVGSGEPISIAEVAHLLARELTPNGESAILPQFTAKFRAGDIRHCFADIRAAQRVLGYRPQVRFAEGVQELAGWIKLQSPTSPELSPDGVPIALRQLEAFGLTA